MKDPKFKNFLEEARIKLANLQALALDPQGRVSIEISRLERPVTRFIDLSYMSVGTILKTSTHGEFEKMKFGRVERWVDRYGVQESNSLFFLILAEDYYNGDSVTLVRGGYPNDL
jgi:hypothetical protein